MNLPKSMSVTKLSDALTCLMKFELRHNLRYSTIKISPALFKGRAFHEMENGETPDWSLMDPDDADMVQRCWKRFQIWKSKTDLGSLDIEREVEMEKQLNGVRITGRADGLTKDRRLIYDVKTTSRTYIGDMQSAQNQLNILNFLAGGEFTTLWIIVVKLVLPKTGRGKYADQLFWKSEAPGNLKIPEDLEDLPQIAPIIHEIQVPPWPQGFKEDEILRTIENIKVSEPVPVRNDMTCGFCEFREYCTYALPSGWGDNWLEDNCERRE